MAGGERFLKYSKLGGDDRQNDIWAVRSGRSFHLMFEILEIEEVENLDFRCNVFALG